MANVPDTTLTAEALRARLGGGSGTSGTTLEAAEGLLAEATVLVKDALIGADPAAPKAFKDVPVEMVDLVTFRVARSLKDGNKASTGAGQVGVTDGVPLRSPADPLASSYPIIRRYVVIGL